MVVAEMIDEAEKIIDANHVGNWLTIYYKENIKLEKKSHTHTYD